jgi:hypothetical protein
MSTIVIKKRGQLEIVNQKEAPVPSSLLTKISPLCPLII